MTCRRRARPITASPPGGMTGPARSSTNSCGAPAQGSGTFPPPARIGARGPSVVVGQFSGVVRHVLLVEEREMAAHRLVRDECVDLVVRRSKRRPFPSPHQELRPAIASPGARRRAWTRRRGHGLPSTTPGSTRGRRPSKRTWPPPGRAPPEVAGGAHLPASLCHADGQLPRPGHRRAHSSRTSEKPNCATSPAWSPASTSASRRSRTASPPSGRSRQQAGRCACRTVVVGRSA